MRDAGMEVLWWKCVRAGDWDAPLDPAPTVRKKSSFYAGALVELPRAYHRPAIRLRKSRRPTQNASSKSIFPSLESAHARREKSIRHGHISTLHIWWARRPLAACRAVICALWPIRPIRIARRRFGMRAAS